MGSWMPSQATGLQEAGSAEAQKLPCASCSHRADLTPPLNITVRCCCSAFALCCLTPIIHNSSFSSSSISFSSLLLCSLHFFHKIASCLCLVLPPRSKVSKASSPQMRPVLDGSSFDGGPLLEGVPLSKESSHRRSPSDVPLDESEGSLEEGEDALL